MIRVVEPAAWRESVQALRDEGYGYFDWLGATDEIGRSDTLRVLLALRSLERGAELVLIETSVPRDDARLDSIAEVFAGAGWHEREAAELFGIEFVGGDPRRLLLDPGFVGTPLRKDEVLAARTAVNWPGAKEPGESGDQGGSPARRRLVPPGIPDPEVWGDRPADAATADPGEIAGSLEGGRARRRRVNPRGDTPRPPRGEK